MLMDLVTVATAVASFALALLIHLISFRKVRAEQVLRSLLLTFGASLFFPLIFMAMMGALGILNVPGQAWACAAFLAMVLDGLLCFVYVLCIFGPYETSVRMRLVREIAQGKDKGISLQELLNRYSEKTIVDIRMRRLLGSGDIIEENGVYRSGRSGNVFFVFDAIAGILKKWIGDS
jgi:hypothetical protein